jgi:hypothetical protein
VGPSAASGPLNGARSATTREEPEALAPVLALVFPLLLVLELQAARPAAASPAAVRPAAARRTVRSLRPDARSAVLSDLRVLAIVVMLSPLR